MDFLQPEGWARPRGFSNGTMASGRVIQVAGQVGRDPVTDAFAGDFGAQVRQALANVVAVVAAGGGTAADITSLTWYVTDIGAYKAAGRDIGTAYKELIGKHFPAMTLVQVVALLDDRAQVEIEATAVLPG